MTGAYNFSGLDEMLLASKGVPILSPANTVLRGEEPQITRGDPVATEQCRPRPECQYTFLVEASNVHPY